MSDKHEAYFSAQPPEVAERLRRIQAEVERRVPQATRHIGYKMPAFRLKKVFFYFAGFKNHVGVYPPLPVSDPLVERLEAFRGPKGNLQFPHKDPLPLDLIGDVAERLASQYGGLAP